MKEKQKTNKTDKVRVVAKAEKQTEAADTRAVPMETLIEQNA